MSSKAKRRKLKALRHRRGDSRGPVSSGAHVIESSAVSNTPSAETGDEASASRQRPFMSPYSLAKITQDAADGKSALGPGLQAKAQALPWLPAKVAAMSTDDIERTLVAAGIRHSRERFLAMAAQSDEAWPISEIWRAESKTAAPRFDDFLGLAACELWKRWLPERPSVEMLDDMMQEGYRLHGGKSVPACELWWKVWRVLWGRFPASAREVDSVEHVFKGMQCISNWCQDFSHALQEASRKDAGWAARGLQYCEEFLGKFTEQDELFQINFSRDRAFFLFELRRPSEAIAVLESVVTRWPWSPWGYVALADEFRGPPWWHEAPGPTPDRARARVILERGLAAMDPRDADREAIDERLRDLQQEERGHE